MALTVRSVGEDDLPALLQHFQVAFGRWPWVEVPVTPLEHLAWKTESGPGPAHNFVAEVDGKIVAAKLNHIWMARVGNRELRTVRGYDSSVHPDYQNRGIMGELRDTAIREMTPLTDLLCGGSNNPAMARLLHQGDRVSFAHRWSVLTRYFDLRAAVSALRPRPAASLPEVARRSALLARWLLFRVSDRAAFRPRRPWTVRTVKRFDERFDAFCREASAPFDFIMVRSQRLLNWRYADPRAGLFTIRVAEQEGRVLGYAVLATRRGAGFIPDILALPGRLDVVDSLVRDAAEYLQACGVPHAECWLLSNHPYAGILKRCGFYRRTGRVPPTLEAVNVLRSDIEFLAGTDAAIHFTAGDTDLV
jgi:GNAT superfamily N-acetyltransferase